MRRCQLTHIDLTGLLDQAWDILILASASCSSRPASFRIRRGVTLWVGRANSRSHTHISQNPATGLSQLSGLLTRRPFSDMAARVYSDARSDYLACPWRATVLAVSVGRPEDELRWSINHACAARAPRARIAGQRSASPGSGLSLGGHRGSQASPGDIFWCALPIPRNRAIDCGAHRGGLAAPTRARVLGRLGHAPAPPSFLARAHPLEAITGLPTTQCARGPLEQGFGPPNYAGVRGRDGHPFVMASE
jgi:hypothetical protein